MDRPQNATDPLLAGAPDVTVTRTEELLQVTTERVATSVVRVSRFIVTETVTQTHQVSHEELRIDHLPVGGASIHPMPTDVDATGSRDLEVILHAERLAVTKETVPVERVTITVTSTSEQREIHDTVRREQIDLAGVDGTARTLRT